MNYKGLSFSVASIAFSVALLSACSDDNQLLQDEQEQHTLRFITTVNGYTHEDGTPASITRTNMAGTDFATGDRIKIKIVCPYSNGGEFGETTYSETADGLWILKWTGSKWENIDANDKVDVRGVYKYDGSYNIFGHYEAQQTPYVYTASTWNENVLFITNSRFYSQYSFIFQADQSTEANYLKSDLLWAQTFMQTGAWNVHLAFNHMMACLKIDVSALTTNSDAVVQLKGMPDIDQREVVVGDYYAERAINITQADYSYKEKCKCSYENNGKVLGVALINDALAKAIVYPMTGNPNPNSRTTIPNTATYTAHRDGGFYYLIVPPCTLSEEAVFWVYDGENRYSYPLNRATFEQGKLYPVTISAPVVSEP